MGGSCGSELMEEGSELLDVDQSRRCWGAGVRSRWCLDEQSTHRRVEGTRTAIRLANVLGLSSSGVLFELSLFGCVSLEIE